MRLSARYHGLELVVLYATAYVPVLPLEYGSTLIFTVPLELAVNDRAVDHPESSPVKILVPLL